MRLQLRAYSLCGYYKSIGNSDKPSLTWACQSSAPTWLLLQAQNCKSRYKINLDTPTKNTILEGGGPKVTWRIPDINGSSIKIVSLMPPGIKLGKNDIMQWFTVIGIAVASEMLTKTTKTWITFLSFNFSQFKQIKWLEIFCPHINNFFVLGISLYFLNK